MVEDFQAIPYGPGTVRVTWESIDVEFMDLEQYSYVVYYEEVQTIGQERSVSVPSYNNFVVLQNLTINVEHQFAVAISRQIGMEKYTGERTSPRRLKVLRGVASGSVGGSMEIRGK